jgi:hypothetical protein
VAKAAAAAHMDLLRISREGLGHKSYFLHELAGPHIYKLPEPWRYEESERDGQVLHSLRSPGGTAHPITAGGYKKQGSNTRAALGRLKRDALSQGITLGTAAYAMGKHHEFLSPAAVGAVKRDPSPIEVGPVAGLGHVREFELDQSRTVFRTQVGQLCDLTGEGANWVQVYDPDNAVEFYDKMDPLPWLDHEFPMRDGSAPLHKVHPDFAGKPHYDKDKNEFRYLHEDVELTAVELADSSRDLAVKGVKVTREALARLREDVENELRRLMHNSRPQAQRQGRPARAQVRRLTHGDVASHESMLVGQYGLFATAASAKASAGQILGIYMGALLRGEADEARAQASHPGYQRYLLDASGSRGSGGQVSTYSADGSANSTAFANTALKPFQSGQRPSYDEDRINAAFINYRVTMTDNQKRPHTEHIAALVGRENLTAGEQILVNYGHKFPDQFIGPSAREQRAQRRAAPPAPKRIKTEHHEPRLPTPGPSTQPPPDPAPRTRPVAALADFHDYFNHHLDVLVQDNTITAHYAQALLDILGERITAAGPNANQPELVITTLTQLHHHAVQTHDPVSAQIMATLLGVATNYRNH